MLRSNAHKNNQGFTLIETLTILIIIGILSAIAAPSFLGMLNRNKVNNALSEVQGAFQEAQREAIRRSKNCTVVISAGNNVTLTSPNNCLVTGDRTLKGINIRRDTTMGIITFNFKGETTTSGSDTKAIVVSLANDTGSLERCLIISTPLGLIKTGVYSDTQRNRNTIDPNDSSTDPNCTISR
ncbi:MAG: prepilin-type N-terminal cleavage/methylation domain-containing protein [Gloeocapsa sp. UFS-A4-WI-NPMV-4B04]|jgi:prepilin-type N-terminal cleavage/methylation domain-containing protein|nr:prepilin-type N-terminal cleavage/methylation domain-containing protein [Gloeocapsa sp. UFS-A4-WI-NPMV-4B04]